MKKWPDGRTLHWYGLAGIIDKAKTARKILRPILDPDLVHWLEQNDMGAYVKALAGVR